MASTKESIGERISRLRVERNLSQDRLVELSKIPRRTIQNIEYGRTKDPGIIPLTAIAEALSVTLHELAYGERNKPKVTASDLSPEEFARAVAIAGQTSDPNKAELLSLIDKVPASRIRALIRRIEVFLKSSPDELQMPAPRRRVSRRKD